MFDYLKHLNLSNININNINLDNIRTRDINIITIVLLIIFGTFFVNYVPLCVLGMAEHFPAKLILAVTLCIVSKHNIDIAIALIFAITMLYITIYNKKMSFILKNCCSINLENHDIAQLDKTQDLLNKKYGQ